MARLEAIIAGTRSKGAAGENIVEGVLANFPPEWQIRNFTVQGRTCEFGLRLANGLVLPIDSKWNATQLIEDFARAQDVEERQRIKGSIERAVLAKAAEVQKYIDAQLTTSFAVAVVPDAAYEISGAALAQSLSLRVVVVSYAMFIPYLLLVFHTILKTSQNIDLEALERAIQETEKAVNNIRAELEGRHARGLTMIQNARDEISANAGRVSSCLSNIRVRRGTGCDPTSDDGMHLPQSGGAPSQVCFRRPMLLRTAVRWEYLEHGTKGVGARRWPRRVFGQLVLELASRPTATTSSRTMWVISWEHAHSGYVWRR